MVMVMPCRKMDVCECDQIVGYGCIYVEVFLSFRLIVSDIFMNMNLAFVGFCSVLCLVETSREIYAKTFPLRLLLPRTAGAIL